MGGGWVLGFRLPPRRYTWGCWEIVVGYGMAWLLLLLQYPLIPGRKNLLQICWPCDLCRKNLVYVICLPASINPLVVDSSL